MPVRELIATLRSCPGRYESDPYAPTGAGSAHAPQRVGAQFIAP
ncbi:MAG: hypothetical protein ACYDER_04245 [Ktedonobacteraceae bacterium]